MIKKVSTQLDVIRSQGLQHVMADVSPPNCCSTLLNETFTKGRGVGMSFVATQSFFCRLLLMIL